MLTRGYLIGQIVDDLSDIASQARQRARLGFTDMHVYIENFAKEVLNRTLGLSLRNLNEEEMNTPGLDLGDAVSGWGFQITGDRSLQKVKSTLQAIRPEDRTKYPRIRIMIIGDRQNSYALTGEPYSSFGFTEDMIWDLNDVCRQVVGMQIENLVALRDYVSLETQRVKIQLEVPDQKGQYPTNVSSLFEAIPRPQLSDGFALAAFCEARDYMIDPPEVAELIRELSLRLSRLPRLTREIFRTLLDRRDHLTAGFDEEFRISQPMIDRIYLGSDIGGDLSLMKEAGLLEPNQADEPFDANYWRFKLPGSESRFHDVLVAYMKDKGIDPQKAFVVLDFSDF